MFAFHNSRDLASRSPFGAVAIGTDVKLALETDTPDATVTLRTWIDGQGEALYPMDSLEDGRFETILTPASTGIIWYQFIIETSEGAWRYGAQDGRFGGEGQLVTWEPPSFQLTVFDPDNMEDTATSPDPAFESALIGFLTENPQFTAYTLAETISSLQETLPHLQLPQALDSIGVPDKARLFAQLAGMQPNDTPDERQAGLAKGRLWCASLIQLLLPDQIPADTLTQDWGEVDGDCETVVRNVFDLRKTVPQFENGSFSCQALNDDVIALWRNDGDGAFREAVPSAGDKGKTAAEIGTSPVCTLVNASLSRAHDVLIPLRGEAVTEIIAGYGIPIEKQPDGTSCARVHLNQLGTAILSFHNADRLQRPIEPGIGILAHITSLPSMNPSATSASPAESPTSSRMPGTLGAPARAFADMLAETGAKYWQVLPVNPTDGYGSPYAGISAFAGNTRLIEGKATLKKSDADSYREFVERSRDWLEPYASFMAIRRKLRSKKVWQEWPKKYRHFDPELIKADPQLEKLAEKCRREQFAFERQWLELRRYANERGIRIIGDMPLYVSADSADVWASPDIFQLDSDGNPTAVAGCPPDSFAADGQIWGNPLYDWDTLAATGYGWWLRRLERAFELYDYVRLDHFIGFARYYAIPDGAKATEGEYQPGPGFSFFLAAVRKFGPLPLIAEDLGLITPAVRGLGALCGFPGMDVVQFCDGCDPLAWYHPRPEKIVYTGTHDNQTIVGFAASRYPDQDPVEVGARLIDIALECSADVKIIPLQDLQLLDDSARMNVPGVAKGNWIWQAEDIESKYPLKERTAR